MSTAEVLDGMLKEKVAHHFLDSGDHYGRQYQRNQGIDMEAQPRSTVKFSTWRGAGGTLKLSVEMSHNTYHWLKERLELNEELNDMLSNADSPFRKEHDADGNTSWFQLADALPEWLSANADANGKEYGECGGIYGEGSPVTINTYNEDNFLNQTIQFVYFENERFGEVVLLQIHGGCDVRGGYTAPQAFTTTGHSELAIFEYTRGQLYCDQDERHPDATAMKEMQEKQLKLHGVDVFQVDFDGRHNWMSDSGSSAFSDETYPVEVKFDIDSNCDIKVLTEEDNEWEYGVLCITEYGEGYCPHCGGKLKADFY